jgi:toxin ParE1/3/4
MNLTLHDAARLEIREAAEYYANESRKLAVDFRWELNRALEIVVNGPLRFEQIRPGVRRLLLERFPYGIYYRMPDDMTIRIIAVKHHSRRPGLGMRRP